jgi:Sulfotransferase family
MPSNRLPNFFIIGAPKAGTTSLYHYLRQHPQIFMSPVKEPCYFASEVRLENFSPRYAGIARRQSENLRAYFDGSAAHGAPSGIVSRWEDYCKLFDGANGACAAGEASVCYLWSPSAAVNIRAAIPGARIIVILRDPAERAFSQYLHCVADGVVDCSFREQIERGVRNASRQFNPLYPFLEYGLYSAQVKSYLDLFPPDVVRIFLYEEAWRDPKRLLREVFSFLNIDPYFEPDTSMRALERCVPRSLTGHRLLRNTRVAAKAKSLLPPSLYGGLRAMLFQTGRGAAMHPGDRRFLADYYRDDIRTLETLLNRELAIWTRPTSE